MGNRDIAFPRLRVFFRSIASRQKSTVRGYIAKDTYGEKLLGGHPKNKLMKNKKWQIINKKPELTGSYQSYICIDWIQWDTQSGGNVMTKAIE